MDVEIPLPDLRAFGNAMAIGQFREEWVEDLSMFMDTEVVELYARFKANVEELAMAEGDAFTSSIRTHLEGKKNY